jgi:hypothetical protein
MGETTPRRFYLERRVDVTGASGTGRVADGVLWTDGTVTIRWTGQHSSTVVWDSIDDALAVHGHVGATRFVWIDEDGTSLRHERDEARRELADLRGKITTALGLKPDTEDQFLVRFATNYRELAVEQRESLRFVASRYLADGSGVRFSNDRCTGRSSDAMAWFGVGMRPEPVRKDEYPRDESDLAACERTYGMAPPHVQRRMLPILQAYRDAIVGVSTPSPSGPEPRVWREGDSEPTPWPNMPVVKDRWGIEWVGDERHDGFTGWRCNSHGFQEQWRTWGQLTSQRGDLTEVLDTTSEGDRGE